MTVALLHELIVGTVIERGLKANLCNSTVQILFVRQWHKRTEDLAVFNCAQKHAACQRIALYPGPPDTYPACAVGAVVLADVFLVNAITSGLVVTL